MVALFCLVSMGTSFLPTFWAIPTETLTRAQAATAVGIINAAGNIAGFAGPYGFGYLNTRTGSFSYGLAFMMVASLVAAYLILRIPVRQGNLAKV